MLVNVWNIIIHYKKIYKLEEYLTFPLKEFITINIVQFFHFNKIFDLFMLKFSSDIKISLNINFRNDCVHQFMSIARSLKAILKKWWFCIVILNVSCILWIFTGAFRLGKFNEPFRLVIFNGGCRFWICYGGWRFVIWSRDCSSEINISINMNSRNHIV